MVLTSTGEVLTNNHVIEGATTITATDVGNGKTYKADVVGYDRTNDVAVIQLHERNRSTDRQPRRLFDSFRRFGRRRGRQRRWQRRHAELRRWLGDGTQPVDHRQRRERRHLGEPHRADRDERRYRAG